MHIAARDGFNLRAATWMPEGGEKPKGTVCILQGRAEFIEKYFEVISELRRRGFAVATFDWRGQGLSGREVKDPRKGHVRRFADYRLDLEAVHDKVLKAMPEPHFALAHSMGGAIALHAAHEGWLPFQRLVAAAPMISLSIIKYPHAASWVAWVLKYLGFGKSYVPGGGATSIATMPFKDNRLTSDPVRYARNAETARAVGDGAVGAPTNAWLVSAFRFMKRFTDPRYGLKIRLPTLVIAGGDDRVCSTPAIERFSARLKSGHAIVLPGARHEIMMEKDEIRELFWVAFDAFIPGSSETSRAARGLADSAAEQLDGGGMDAAVAGGDDAAAIGR
nr:alpha/beta hydrolase [Microvirga terricola]